MGLLPPNEFEEILVKEAKLKKDIAKNAGREISRLIFFPLKEILSQLYEVEIISTAGTRQTKAETAPPSESAPEKMDRKPLPEPPRPSRPRETDTYRENIE